MSSSPPSDIFHVPRDEEYLRLLREEEEFWDVRPDTMLSKEALPSVQRYHNERLTGDAERQWFEVISDYGDFKRGCVLGAGPGDVESHLLQKHQELRLTIYDISGESLTRLKDRLDREHPGRAEICQEDLNFVTLPAESYDLGLARSSIHHILNLEHLGFQLNRSLTRNGFFFMLDNVGESRFQYSEEKKRLFQALIDATRGNESTINWPDRGPWSHSPFEAVRSGEILEVFGRYLREVRLRTCNALLALGLHVRPGIVPHPWGRLRARAFKGLLRIVPALRRNFARSSPAFARMRTSGKLLIMLDRICSDTGYLKPGMAFAIYQKRGAQEPPK